MSRIVPAAIAARPRAKTKARRFRAETALGVLLTALMLFPVYWMINESFTTDQNIRENPPNLIPIDGTLDGYRAVLSEQLPYLGTSLGIGLATVAVTLVIAAPAGYALAKLRPRGGGAVSFALLVAQMIPSIIMAMGFYAILLQIGWINTLPGLVLADSTISVPAPSSSSRRSCPGSRTSSCRRP